MQQHRHSATHQSRLSRVGAAGKNGGHARAEHDARELCAAKIFKLLGQHVAALKIGHHQNVGLAGNR
jgi:hypothetical protein